MSWLTRVFRQRQASRSDLALFTLLLSGLVLLGARVDTWAQTNSEAVDASKLRIAVKTAPPFVVERANSQFEGIAIELWERIAAGESLQYEYVPVSLQELLQGVQEGRFQLGIGALTVTAEREERLDFSHPFHSSGLAIATRSGSAAGFAVLEGLLSTQFLRILGGLLVLLLAVGVLVWWFERRHNPDEFDPQPGRGLGAGFWFAAVTMTTVGYGDKTPRSVGGRLISLVWMFAAIIVISFFTAGLASSLTVKSLRAAVDGPEDLPRVRVATVPGTTSANYLDQRGIDFEPAETVPELLRMLEAEIVEAVVYDAPILHWELGRLGSEDLLILPGTFEPQDYAFALTEGHPRRERINRSLLEERESAAFARLLEEYLGR